MNSFFHARAKEEHRRRYPVVSPAAGVLLDAPAELAEVHHQHALVIFLIAFGACVVPGLIALELHARQIFPGTIDQLLRVAAGTFIFGSAIFGTLLATYTGVLIGATAIPAWFLHRTLLPIHFGTAGLGSAAALLELLGHRIAALNFLGFYAAGVETVLLIWLSVDKHGSADRAIHEHGSGWLIRIGEVLNGPLAIVLRLFSQIPLAALSFLIGVVGSSL